MQRAIPCHQGKDQGVQKYAWRRRAFDAAMTGLRRNVGLTPAAKNRE
jgi:hypothetical protein